jgi:hypothetical protein
MNSPNHQDNRLTSLDKTSATINSPDKASAMINNSRDSSLREIRDLTTPIKGIKIEKTSKMIAADVEAQRVVMTQDLNAMSVNLTIRAVLKLVQVTKTTFNLSLEKVSQLNSVQVEAAVLQEATEEVIVDKKVIDKRVEVRREDSKRRTM